MNPRSDSSVNPAEGFTLGLVPGRAVGGGRFLLDRQLGEGGMGVVWLAQDRLLREFVALKFLPSRIALDPAALQGLRREALRARKLAHPNIIRIHDLIDPSHEMPFICMEYVDGSTLHALRARQPDQVLSWDFLFPVARQLCAALDYAHGEKLIHRDLKPANLMLDKCGRLKLGDFGLARIVCENMSRLSEQANTSGTLAYMSPQQANGLRPSVSDDIYSLGVSLYELLTSTPPFCSGDIGHQIRNREPQSLEERLAELDLANEVPAAASSLVLDCLAKDPLRRPATARAVLERLDAGAPKNLERPPMLLSAGQPQARRRRPRLTLIASAMAIVLALAAWRIATPGKGQPASTTLTPIAELDSVSSSPVEPAGPAFEDGFDVLFNGRDLAGWDGDTNYWHVRDGVIMASTAEEGIRRRENTCLIWREPVDDFELRLEFRLQDVITAKPANSGILYRGKRLHGWRVQGYQCDLHGVYTATFLLLWDTLDDLRVVNGHSAVIRDGGGRPVVQSIRRLGRPDAIKNALRAADWNELTIVAQGNRLQHFLNGIMTSDVVDETLSAQSRSGVLALELKRATTLQFKSIRMKRLASSSPSPSGK